MTGRVARRAQDDHAVVAESPFVGRPTLRPQLSLLEPAAFAPDGRLAMTRPVPPFRSQRGVGNGASWPVLSREVADADVLHRSGFTFTCAGSRRCRLGPFRSVPVVKPVPHH